MIFPLIAALRHLPLAGPRIHYSLLWSGAVFPDFCKAERDFILSPWGEEIVSVYLLGTQISERLKRNGMH
jgi:hypothetical protein